MSKIRCDLDWKIKACEEIGDSKGAAEAQNRKSHKWRRTNRYDNLLYEYEQKKIIVPVVLLIYGFFCSGLCSAL